MHCNLRADTAAVVAALCLLRAATAAGLPHGGVDHSGKTVHVVFSNHLDIGFDGIDPALGTDDAVINKYFDEYFPRAVRHRFSWNGGDGVFDAKAWFDIWPGVNPWPTCLQIETAKQLRDNNRGDRYIWMAHVSRCT